MSRRSLYCRQYWRNIRSMIFNHYAKFHSYSNLLYVPLSTFAILDGLTSALANPVSPRWFSPAYLSYQIFNFVKQTNHPTFFEEIELRMAVTLFYNTPCARVYVYKTNWLYVLKLSIFYSVFSLWMIYIYIYLLLWIVHYSTDVILIHYQPKLYLEFYIGVMYCVVLHADFYVNASVRNDIYHQYHTIRLSETYWLRYE